MLSSADRARNCQSILHQLEKDEIDGLREEGAVYTFNELAAIDLAGSDLEGNDMILG